MNRQLASALPFGIHADMSGPILRRSCGCGGSCGSCQEKKERPLQRKASLVSRGGRDFSRVPAGRNTTSVRVGAADDAFEREADRVADAVMSGGAASPRTAGAQHVQREIDEESPAPAPAPAPAQAAAPAEDEAAAGEDEGVEETESEDGEGGDDDPTGQPKLADGASRGGGRVDLPLASGGGSPLDAGTRETMQGGIGHDFSGVRVHTGREAAQAAESVHARAFTVGSDIYFASGAYQPSSGTGQRLLAHELTHVVQQSGGSRPSLVQRAPQDPQKAKPKQKAKEKPKEKAKEKPKKVPDKFCKKPNGDNCKVPCGPDNAACDGNCVPASNPKARNPCCGNEKCPGSPAVNPKFFIRHLDVNLKTQMVTAEWGDATTTKSVSQFLSSPNPGKTPTGMHQVGVKCGPCHTNCDGSGMGWFTGFPDLQFGFHNSQTVAVGTKSHGCVRIPCGCAKEVQANTSTGTTSVCIHNGGGCKSHDLPTFGAPDKAHSSVCAAMFVAGPPAPKAAAPPKKAAPKKPAKEKAKPSLSAPPAADQPAAAPLVSENEATGDEEVA
jgi:Domain of unknown function (DUF4157)